MAVWKLPVAGAVVLMSGGDSFRGGAVCPALLLFILLSQSEKVYHLKIRENNY
jgi:hypothetical protein